MNISSHFSQFTGSTTRQRKNIHNKFSYFSCSYRHQKIIITDVRIQIELRMSFFLSPSYIRVITLESLTCFVAVVRSHISYKKDLKREASLFIKNRHNRISFFSLDVQPAYYKIEKCAIVEKNMSSVCYGAIEPSFYAIIIYAHVLLCCITVAKIEMTKTYLPNVPHQHRNHLAYFSSLFLCLYRCVAWFCGYCVAKNNLTYFFIISNNNSSSLPSHLYTEHVVFRK